MYRRGRGFAKIVENDKYLKFVLEENRRDIQRVCSNNGYLLGLVGRSVYRQLKDIAAHGFEFCESAYSHLKSGDSPNCSNYRLRLLASYWGLGMGDMIGRDLRAEGYQLPVDWVPPSERPEFK